MRIHQALLGDVLQGARNAANVTHHLQLESRLPGVTDECEIIGDIFGVLVQGLLFLVVVAVLAGKWWFESPRRDLLVFLLDSSKQMVGSFVMHFTNVILAVFWTTGKGECGWYWINVMLDTTVGLLLNYGFLRLSEKLLGYNSGLYGEKSATGIDWQQNPNFGEWGHQICVWCLCCCCMKMVVVAIMAAFPSFWMWVGEGATSWIQDPQAQLLFVMIATPTVMNIFQMLITDTFLKFTVGKKPKEAV